MNAQKRINTKRLKIKLTFVVSFLKTVLETSQNDIETTESGSLTCIL